MKKAGSGFIIFTLLLLLVKVAESQTVTVSGNAFLEFQQFHNDIKVKFERIAPSYLADSTLTDSSGYYNLSLESGIYSITYSKTEYIDIQLTDLPIYHDTTLMDQTLESIGLSGELIGQLSSGEYKVGGDIYIPANDTLIIQPGTILKFMQDVKFEIYGTLKAEGTHEDSIRFTHYNSDQYWKGIDFKENASDSSTINYCIVEFSDDRGISVFKCSPNISNSVIQYNTHQSSTNGQEEQEGGGAGICLKYSNTVVKNVIVRHNSGVTLGCGIYCSDGNPYISNSIIFDNVNPQAFNSNSIRPGGGIYCTFDANLTVENSVICNNANSIGGGICASGLAGVFIPELTVVNSIIYENSASEEYGFGGGIATFNGADLSVLYSLLWNNEGGNFSCDDNWLGVNVTVNNNMDSCDAYSNLIMNPLFVSPATGDFSLDEESPCIDAGNNSYVTSEIDFAHNYRLWDGNYDNDTIVDIGAYEYDSQSVPVGIIINNDVRALNKEIVFPNPAFNHININIDNISNVQIYDNSGRLVLMSKQAHIDISKLNSGLYIVKILDKEQNYHSEKILKY